MEEVDRSQVKTLREADDILAKYEKACAYPDAKGVKEKRLLLAN